VAMTEARQDLADTVIDLLGPEGLLRDGVMGGRFEENWRAEIITSIAGGANEIQRTIIAQRGLGLPRG
jgi:alkylation response protein AidB-like acyl-CoA dehydrogenase